MDIPAVPEQVIVQRVPEARVVARVVEQVSRIRVPQVIFPLVDVPKISLQNRIQLQITRYGDTDEEHVEL